MDVSKSLSFEERLEVYNYAAVEQNEGDCDCGLGHHKGRVTGWSKVDHSGLIESLERVHDGIEFELVSTDEL